MSKNEEVRNQQGPRLNYFISYYLYIAGTRDYLLLTSFYDIILDTNSDYTYIMLTNTKVIKNKYGEY